MKTKNTLHDLVHCLNTSEKRQFKLYLKIYNQSKEGNVVRLFDAYNKMKEFCEQELVANLKGDKILNNFPYEKHRLQKAITDFLVNKESDDSNAVELNNLLNQALVLRSKNQFILSLKALEKGIKLAAKYELNFHHALFLKYSFLLKLRLFPNNIEELEKDNDKLLNIGQEIATEIKYVHFLQEMSLFNFVESRTPSEDLEIKKEAILAKTVINDIEGATNYHAKNALYLGRLYFYNIVNPDQTIDEVHAINALLNENSLKLAEEHRTYIGNLFYMAEYYIYQSQYETALDSLSKIQEFKEKYVDHIQKRTFFEIKGDMLFNLFCFFIFTGNIKDMGYVFREHHKAFRDYLKSAIRNIEFYYLIGMILAFYTRNFGECLNWLNDLEEDDENRLDHYVVYSCKMISVMALYEQKEFILMRSQFSNLYYYARNNKLKTPFFKKSQKVLRKLSNEPETSFANFEKALIHLKEAYEPSPYGQNVFIMWLESKIAQVEFCHIVEKDKIPINENRWKHLLV